VRGALLKELNLDQYARLLRRVAAGNVAVAFCTPEGEPLWTAEGTAVTEIQRALRELTEFESAFVSEGASHRLSIGGGRTLLYAPVPCGRSEGIGLLAALVETSSCDDQLEMLEGVLVDLVACIGREYRLNLEANSLAEEITNRYEELNLLYSVGGHARAFDQGVAGTEALLGNLAERLDIDLAAFVISTLPAPIHVIPRSEKIYNLDLVLTAIRGDLFRFATTGRTSVILNAADDPRRPYLFINMPYRVLACPVVDCGATQAMLVLMRLEGRPEFTNGDRNLGMVIANQTAIMMQNHSMMSSLQQFGEQLAGSLIAAIEAKDPYTRGHSERVQKTAIRLGRAADLSASALDDVSWGALLHDVGKIGVPESIICKAGALTDDEYTMIKTHPERTFEIIRHIESLGQGVLDAARYHHERFDGSGYPHGLRGKQIPVAARVISVADTYDAVTSSRSYRPAASHADALQILRDAAGSQLDADLVRVFENLCQRDRALPAALQGSGEPGDA